MHKIRIEKLDKPYRDGDWHDPYLKWSVIGPGTEVQNFYTKANATLYKRFRKQCTSMQEASFLYRIHV